MRVARRGYLFAEVPYRIGVRKRGVSKALTFSSLCEVVKGYLRLIKDCYFGGEKRKQTFVDGSVSADRYKDG